MQENQLGFVANKFAEFEESLFHLISFSTVIGHSEEETKIFSKFSFSGRGPIDIIPKPPFGMEVDCENE